jgi:hypothetical protein
MWADSGSCLLTPDSAPHSSLPDPRYFDRVSLTSRAFAVTEAAVAFDRCAVRSRRRIAASWYRANSGGAWPRCNALASGCCWLSARRRRARHRHWRPRTSTISCVTIRCRGAAGALVPIRSQGANGCAVRAGGGRSSVPAHWAALAAALGDERLARASNLLANGTFAKASAEGQQPQFLIRARASCRPTGSVRAVATEHAVWRSGRPLPACGVCCASRALGTRRSARRSSPCRDGCIVAKSRCAGGAAGNDAALTLAFVDAGGKTVGDYRSTMLPKGRDRVAQMVLAASAPEKREVCRGWAYPRCDSSAAIGSRRPGFSLRVAE